MARGKKRKKTTHRRRRARVSGVHPAIMQTAVMLAGAAAGAVTGVFAYQALKTSVTSAPPVALGLGIAAAGAAIPLFVKPSPFVMGASAGLAGIGAVFAVNEAGLSLPGISGTPMPNPNGPGYVNRTVGYLNANRYPARMIGGNLSGNGSRTVGRIFSN